MRIQRRTQRRTPLRPDSEDVISVAIASGSKPRRVPLVFVVKSQRKLRLRQNKKRYDEDSKENAKENPFEA
ncbi:hypothetical protein Bca4012_009812 [Brassica carinata]